MNESFFGFDEDDEYTAEGPHRSSWRWIGVVLALLTLVITGWMLFVGMRTVSSAEKNEPYVGHSWVISGNLVDMSRDLQTDTYNGVYLGHLPDDPEAARLPFDGGVDDPKDLEPGAEIRFRGTQTGAQLSDFPQNVDALLVQDEGRLTVVRTTEVGEMSPVTTQGIAEQKRAGWLTVGGGFLVLLAGGAVTWYAVIRARREEDGLI